MLDSYDYHLLSYTVILPFDLIKIYPGNGCLTTGADFEYNLFRSDSGNRVEEQQILDYDERESII
ncbi:hypothetical protein ABFG93_20550 [Pseudalkalibacillus hwajinpoensis]|uniref:hypothetical protein n=1 Tax=Guptibacillus hwajinpoensis TaxID=208199 RepID=UPI00325B869C